MSELKKCRRFHCTALEDPRWFGYCDGCAPEPGRDRHCALCNGTGAVDGVGTLCRDCKGVGVHHLAFETAARKR